MGEIEKLMKALGITREEAQALQQDDKDIDAGKAKDFDLSGEQEAIAKSARSTGTKKRGAYKFERAPRKENPVKRELIVRLLEAVSDEENPRIVNPERVIQFERDGNTYEITLSCKRPPKG